MAGSPSRGVRLLFVVALVLCALARPAFAAIDAYSFPDDASRERYNHLIEVLRCPQCLNTNIAGSDAMIAKDLRREVHRLILEGMDDDEILEYMHDRYGDFILYEPRMTGKTMLLWFGPLLLLLFGLWFFGRLLVNRSRVETTELSAAEQARLQQLLKANTGERAGNEK